MSTDRDQAKLIAERVARRVRESGARLSSDQDPNLGFEDKDQRSKTKSQSPAPAVRNGAPLREELSEIRAGLHDLENHLEQIESRLADRSSQPSEQPRARVIDFVSSSPPV